MDKLEDKSYSKLQSTFRLTGLLLIVRRRLALKQIQLFRPWSAFSFSNTLFALLFMLPSPLSAPSSTFYFKEEAQNKCLPFEKIKHKGIQVPSCSAFFCSLTTSTTLPTSCNLIHFSLLFAAWQPCADTCGTCSRFGRQEGSGGAAVFGWHVPRADASTLVVGQAARTGRERHTASAPVQTHAATTHPSIAWCKHLNASLSHGASSVQLPALS